MTVLISKISWCTGTLNLSVGCTQIPVPGGSACDFCYAKGWVERGLHGTRDFGTLRLFPDRLNDLRKFAPAPNAAGEIEPKLVFVNSLSDFWHDQIPDKFIHDALDRFEDTPKVILQILTKRPVRMRRIMSERYAKSDFPQNIWLGVSAESNSVAARINFLRRLKDQVGEFCAFVSVEPIFAPTDALDFTGMDWILTGGESGPQARPMAFEYLEQANEQALSRGIALHFKQYGHPRNNPMVFTRRQHSNFTVHQAFMQLCEEGVEMAPHEKGGATYKGRIIQDKPPHFYRLKAELNQGALL